MDKKTKETLSKVKSGKSLFSGIGKMAVNTLLVLTIAAGALAPGQANADPGGILHNAGDEIKYSVNDAIGGTLNRGNQNIQNRNAVDLQSGKFNYGLNSAAQTRNYQLQNNTVCTTTSRNNTNFGSNGKTTTSGNISQSCSDRTYTRNIEQDMNKVGQLQRQQATYEQNRVQRLQRQADQDARVLRQQQAAEDRAAANAAKYATKQFQSNAQDMQQNNSSGSSYYNAPKQSQDSGSYKQTQQTQTYKVTGAARYR